MEMGGRIDCKGELGAVLIRKDGTRVDYGLISGGGRSLRTRIISMLMCWKWLFRKKIATGKAPLGMSSLGFLLWSLYDPTALVMFGLVTTAGVNYMATDFASDGVTPTISGFKFHDAGIGTTAAAVGDTDIETTDGEARVSGTASNPAANQYRSVATRSYSTTKAITEWGLFSALTAGSLWDRRVFLAINVVSGDSIQFTYTLTVNNGGS